MLKNLFKKMNILNDKVEEEQDVEIVKTDVKTKKRIQKFVYKISSPENFNPIEHIKHGSYSIYKSIPKWAKNNSRVVIEKIENTEKI